MDIKSYKKISKNKYKVILSDEELTLYDEIIIKYNLLLKKKIDNKELIEIKEANEEYYYYEQALKFINRRLRSESEVCKYLKKYDVSSKVINKIICSLKKSNIINDSLFTEAYVHDGIILSNNGPYKIMSNLEQLKISQDIIKEKIKVFTKELELEKIEKYVSKQIKTNRNKSSHDLKQKILNNLLMLGYNRENIIDILDAYQVDDQSIYEKEYQKEYQKLSKKYSENELEYRIKQKMYQKGFRQ